MVFSLVDSFLATPAGICYPIQYELGASARASPDFARLGSRLASVPAGKNIYRQELWLTIGLLLCESCRSDYQTDVDHPAQSLDHQIPSLPRSQRLGETSHDQWLHHVLD